MKKLLSLLLVVSLLAVCFVSAVAEEPAATPEPEKHTSGDYMYIILEDGTAEIIKYKGKAEELIIPDELDGIRVTSIGDDAFIFCESLNSITIPDSVTSIGANPFNSCSKLTDIIVSIDHPYLATIDGVLFSKPDKRLVCYPYVFTADSYVIPDGIQIIGDYAFYNCYFLTSVTIPDSVTSIGNDAFLMCNSLASVTIPDSVSSIGIRAFCNCGSLTSVTIPDSVTSIGDSAFYSCGFLTSVTIPDSVTIIGRDAFSGCPATFTVGRDSYAKQYCIDNNLKYTYADSLDWLND